MNLPFPSEVQIEPEDIKMLEGVLKAWCAETGNSARSAEAELAARSLIDWFLFGIQTPHKLREMLEPIGLDKH